MADERRSKRSLELPEVEVPEIEASRSDFGPEPEGGWVHGIPGHRIIAPEEHAAHIEQEAKRRGLSDAEKEQWIAAGGGTAWLHRPRWTDADEDDYL